ncbi:Motile sperm domain-containing protein 2 [Camponotus floridanus]|uniref:Motile sperm domain-containing protein 2 n=1 Tax=Camponotus floridanus TaxID=104421 RepID=E2A6C4_CAMFO|nr:motile sperm domain-containing protein 2 [Camponotus floridanus]EFN71009.1 Motile sperm domain-containing protein 2 [Camponotus floridanus]
MEVSAKAITELRDKFFKKLDDEGPPDPKGFHPADIARIKNTDDWLRRFLEATDLNEQEAFNMLWDTCTWRKKFGANDITEDNVKREYLEEGSCYGYGKDKDGKKLLVIKLKLHVKGVKDFAELQRCIVYWFERLEREVDQVSLFFDMAEAGLSNMDMELIKYLINLFKSYYPNFLNYIIIFEMPWILNTAFKLIKSWLPAKAIPKIKLVNKTTLKEFIDPNDALKSWGGSSDYVFKFVPEVRTNGDNGVLNGKLDNKKVHFAENSPITEQSPSPNIGEQTNEEQLLSIEPMEAITFNKDGNDITGTITLKNITTDKSLSYKIKTTSPEKFRVRPSSGILQPSEQRSVVVVLQPGYNIRGLLHNDRFLVMCLSLKNANTTPQELAALWKSEKASEMHRLRCCDGNSENNEVQKSHSILTSTGNDRNIDAFFSKINLLEENCKKLRDEIVTVRYMLLIYMVLTIVIGMLLIYILKMDIKNLVDQQNCHIHHGN